MNVPGSSSRPPSRTPPKLPQQGAMNPVDTTPVASRPVSRYSAPPMSSTGAGGAVMPGRAMPQLITLRSQMSPVTVLSEDQVNVDEKEKAVTSVKYMLEELGKDDIGGDDGLAMDWLVKCYEDFGASCYAAGTDFQPTEEMLKVEDYIEAYRRTAVWEAVQEVGTKQAMENIAKFVNSEKPMTDQEREAVVFVIESVLEYAFDTRNWDFAMMDDGDIASLEQDLIKLSTYQKCNKNPIPEGSTMKVLGNGAYNTTQLVTLPNGGTKVVKPIAPAGQGPGCTMQSDFLGVSHYEPRWEERNLATNRLANRLGFDVVVPTELGVTMDPVRKKSQRTVIMGMAPGYSESKTKTYSLDEIKQMHPNAFVKAESVGWDPVFMQWDVDGYAEDDALNYKVWADDGLDKCGMGKLFMRKNLDGSISVEQTTFRRFPFEDGGFRLKLTQLNYLDALTFQMDRHGNNYFVDMDDQDNCSVRGIDNDMCFPANKVPLQTLVKADYNTVGWNGTRLPEVADAEIYDSIVGISDEDYRVLNADLLTNQELDAGLDRLHFVQDHLRRLEGEGKVIGKSPCTFGWASKKAKSALMEDVKNAAGDTISYTSYYGRELAHYNSRAYYGYTVLNLDGTAATQQYT